MASQQTSQKRKDFVRESMKDKPVDEIDGVCAPYGEKLKAKGFEKASHLLGQFLCMCRDVEVFTTWLGCEIGCQHPYAFDIADCLEHWCDLNL